MDKDLNFEELQNWRKQGKTIVFTNGCFDLLHRGHLDLLSQSAKFGDYLIVGLNSDKSVKKIKGNNRPIEPQNVRMKNLAKLTYVKSVYIFNDQTPLKLIKIIKPNVLVKGGDYSKDEIVGSREIIKWGGRIEIIPLTPGYSTTTIIKNMN